MSEVIYAREERLSVGEYLDVVGHSTLGATRPLADGERIGAMIAHSDLIVSARIEGRCVGLARCLTDFAWVAYCCDLAVHADFQGRGIGTELLRTCRQLLGAGIGIALLSIPEAVSYYDRLERIGLRRYPHAYWMSRGPDA